MADRPFGFGLPDKPGGSGGPGSGGPGPGGPGGGGPGGGGPAGPFGPMGDPQQFADALRQFADMLSWRGGPVNWDLARNVARHAIAAGGDPSVLDAQRREVADAIRLADLWLD
ncbi:MAG TPA: zinc-dependent metalloprotease, partial [Streptosporangiaceae bacterium]|nr:zinc-dependent metalloprotease [Streptosporangiaceae bacterium]